MKVELTEGQRRKLLSFALTERRQLNNFGVRACAKTFERADALISSLKNNQKDG